MNKSNLPLLKSLEKCVDFLRGMFVSVGNVIDLAGFRIAKLKGIRLCVILSFVVENDTIDPSVKPLKVRITRTTDINIVDIQSCDAYNSLVHVNKKQDPLVGGLQQEQKELRELVLHRCCCSPAVFLKGPSGCGKTSLVQQVAAECKAALLKVNGNQLISSDPDINEKYLESLFKKAEQLSFELPCILFFDQLEGLSSKSEKQSSGGLVNAALVSHLKRLCGVSSGHGLLVILATNQPTLLDPSLLRHDLLAKEVSLD